jgi:Protein of unknown function (DUF1826)
MNGSSGMVQRLGTLLLLLLDIAPTCLAYTPIAWRECRSARGRRSPSKFSFETTTILLGASAIASSVPQADTSPTQGYSSEPVIRKHFAKVKPAVWKRWLVPGWWDDDPRGVDETVVWDRHNGSRTLDAAAERLLQLVLPSGSIIPSKARSEMRLDVVASMQSFQDFCEHNKIEQGSFAARLVASRGTVGAKCPIWHVDQVPCRWIQALAGPGCEWVVNRDAVQWDQFYHNGVGGHRDTQDNPIHDTADEALVVSNACRNEQLVNRQRAIVRHAREGEGVILMGSHCGDLDSDVTLAAVHKSPKIAVPWQGRVLLTLNVLRHNNAHDN